MCHMKVGNILPPKDIIQGQGCPGSDLRGGDRGPAGGPVLGLSQSDPLQGAAALFGENHQKRQKAHEALIARLY